jgi:hypothetical protein
MEVRLGARGESRSLSSTWMNEVKRREPSTERPQSLSDYRNLQEASQERHLEAFRRCVDRGDDPSDDPRDPTVADVGTEVLSDQTVGVTV